MISSKRRRAILSATVFAWLFAAIPVASVTSGLSRGEGGASDSSEGASDRGEPHMAIGVLSLRGMVNGGRMGGVG